MSSRKLTKVGVLQGSILVPFLFLMHVNDLKENIESKIKSFADDTSLVNAFHNQIFEIQVLNEGLEILNKWS